MLRVRCGLRCALPSGNLVQLLSHHCYAGRSLALIKLDHAHDERLERRGCLRIVGLDGEERKRLDGGIYIRQQVVQQDAEAEDVTAHRRL